MIQMITILKIFIEVINKNLRNIEKLRKIFKEQISKELI